MLSILTCITLSGEFQAGIEVPPRVSLEQLEKNLQGSDKDTVSAIHVQNAAMGSEESTEGEATFRGRVAEEAYLSYQESCDTRVQYW